MIIIIIIIILSDKYWASCALDARRDVYSSSYKLTNVLVRL